MGVASEVSMQDLNRPPQEYIAANAGKIRELEDHHTQIPEDVQNLKFSVTDRMHKPLAAACRRSRQSDRAATEEPRWLFHRRCGHVSQETNL